MFFRSLQPPALPGHASAAVCMCTAAHASMHPADRLGELLSCFCALQSVCQTLKRIHKQRQRCSVDGCSSANFPAAPRSATPQHLQQPGWQAGWACGELFLYSCNRLRQAETLSKRVQLVLEVSGAGRRCDDDATTAVPE